MGCAIAERFRSDSTPILQPQSYARERNVYVLFVFFVAKQTDPPSHLRCFGAVKRKQTMIKTEINETRTKLVRTILAIKKLKTQKTALAKTLEPDFEAHEAEYRNGVKTDAGVLVRRPKWNFDAKPVVEVS